VTSNTPGASWRRVLAAAALGLALGALHGCGGGGGNPLGNDTAALSADQRGAIGDHVRECWTKDAGALDIARDDDVFEVLAEPAALSAVRAALERAGVEIESADVTQRPKVRVPIEEADAQRLMKLIDTLEESDDVGAVHANFDVDADVLERIAG